MNSFPPPAELPAIHDRMRSRRFMRALMVLMIPVIAAIPGYSGTLIAADESASAPHWSSYLVETLLLRQYNTRLVVLSTSLLGVASGLVGTFLLLRKRSLLGDALSHATLPGIVIAFAIMVQMGEQGKNLPGLLTGAAITGMGGVYLVLLIRNSTRLKDDAAMGIILSVFFGAGVALLSMVQTLPQASAAGLEGFITGKTASMVLSDFLFISVVCALAVLLSLLFLKELTLLCFDEGFAAAQGWPVVALDMLMVSLVGAVTIVGLQSVGLILIIAFLIIPSTAARFWTHNLGRMLVLAGIIGGLSGWFGASVSALFPGLPAGALIVLSAASLFMLSMLFGPAKGVVPRWIRHRRLTATVGRQHLLRAVFEILEQSQQSGSDQVRNLPVDIADVIRHRSWDRPEVLGLLRSALRNGHIEFPRPGQVCLSESGFGESARVTRNHRLWELFMIRHADIAPSHVDRDADMVEHVLGPEIVRQLEDELQNIEATLQVPPSPHTIKPTDEPSVSSGDKTGKGNA